jgi:hypothetical protein
MRSEKYIQARIDGIKDSIEDNCATLETEKLSFEDRNDIRYDNDQLRDRMNILQWVLGK